METENKSLDNNKKDYKKNWYLQNKSRIISKQSKPNECECGGRYQKVNKTQHQHTRKHKKYIILELIKNL